MSSLQQEHPGEWQSDAACVGDMAAAFYPPVGSERKSVRINREQRAKAVCVSCPVRLDCLEHALAHDERYGIWGGMTGRERRTESAA